MKRTALTLAQRQPLAVRAAAVAAVVAIVHVAVVAGLIDVEQEEAIAGAVDALGLLALVFLGAKSVTPNAKVISRVTTEGTVVAGDASTVATGTEIGTAPSPSAGLVQSSNDLVASAPVKPELVEPSVAP